MDEKKRMQDKKIVYFIPHTLEALRYFVRVAETVSDDFRTAMLIIPDAAADARVLVDYCIQHAITFDSFDAYEHSGTVDRLPFMSEVRRLRALRTEVSLVVGKGDVHAFIASDDSSIAVRHLFLEANERRLGTAVLEHSVAPLGGGAGGTQAVGPRARNRLREMLIQNMLRPDLEMSQDLPFGNAHCKRFGVVNARSKAEHKKRGVPEHKMSVVGHLSFAQAFEHLRGAAKDPLAGARLLKRYGLDETKRYIAFFPTPYHRDANPPLSEQEYRELLDFLLTTMRSVFRGDHVGVALKVPSGESHSDYGNMPSWVTIVPDAIPDEDVIAFSSLYVGFDNPAHFLAEIMDKPALFLNLLDLPHVEASRDHYQIKQYITDWREFKLALKKVAEGVLPRQYMYNPVLFPPSGGTLMKDWISNLS